MKQLFIDKKFGSERSDLIEKANTIITEYQDAGYRLTLRQLYYQFVSRNWITNTERSYKNLGNCISDARLAGLIDWEAIEDRVRVPRMASEWNDVESLVESAIAAYRLPRWKGQDNYVELWVEKDALAGVLEPLSITYHVTLMVNRGYSSQSAMYESALRFKRARNTTKAKLHLLYLGDHDPSGEDMVRDVADRLSTFGVPVNVRKIALTMAQVEQYNPPPNPAKMSDSRAQAYVDQHGAESWEVDALPPNVLEELIRDAIEALFDADLMEEIKAREEKDKDALLKAARDIMKRRNRQ